MLYLKTAIFNNVSRLFEMSSILLFVTDALVRDRKGNEQNVHYQLKIDLSPGAV